MSAVNISAEQLRIQTERHAEVLKQLERTRTALRNAVAAMNVAHARLQVYQEECTEAASEALTQAIADARSVLPGEGA